jgi:glycosidase
MKDPALRDNPPNPSPHGETHRTRGAYDSQLHVNDLSHPDLHLVFQRLRSLLDAAERADGRPLVLIGETHDFEWTALCRNYGENLDELHLPFNFGMLNVDWSAPAIRTLVDGYEAALPPGAWPNYVLGNHDEPRVATRLGSPARARLAMLLLLTLRGTPTLYYGDELGMEDVPIPPELEQDPAGKNVPGFGLGRDPCRTPMPWDRIPNGGFCPPDAAPWLPLGDDAHEVNVAAQLADPRSMLSLTRRLLALRRASPALAGGSYRPLDAPEVSDDYFVYVREADGERVLVALNFGDAERPIRLPDGEWAVAVSTHLDREGPVDSRSLTLRAEEGCVLRLG